MLCERSQNLGCHLIKVFIHKNGKADNSRRIWTVYVFLIWHKVFFEDENFTPINKEWLDKRVQKL